jgi:hypothetical protein
LLRKKKKLKKKSNKYLDDMEMDFDEEDEDRYKSKHKSSGDNKPFTKNYEPAYSADSVLSGKYAEAYRARGGMSGEYHPAYKPPAPKPRQEQPQQEQPRQKPSSPLPVVSPPPQRERPPAITVTPIPRMGNFGNGNIKMPAISLGSGMQRQTINMPSINVPTMGSSTLMVGSGLMGRTANNKIGMPSMNIPTIGNWGKTPLKTKLELPSIGNLTIMGAGKKGGIKFGLGEVPNFGLSAKKKKKV